MGIFKQDAHVLEMIHRCDEKMRGLDAEKAAGKDVAEAIKSREKLLVAMYRQVAVQYCDLHDRSGRMKSVGAIHEELHWRNARSYLHWRIRRRLREGFVINNLVEQVPNYTREEAVEIVQELIPKDHNDDRTAAEWIEAHTQEIEDRIETERQDATEKYVFDLVRSLPRERQTEIVRDLQGFVRASEKAASKNKFSPPRR